jgi:hypothetical protein
MQPAAEIDQPIGTVDQRRQHVGREGIHRECTGMALGRRVTATLAIDAGVVDDRIHAPDRVDLFGDAAGFGSAAEIADRNSDAA